MKRIPHISALMTAFPWHLDVNTPAVEARRFMQDHHVHHLPLTRNGHELAGVVEAARIDNGYAGPLLDLLQTVITVDVSERADKVLDLMAQEHSSVVIVTHHGRLAGIFTWTDVCRLYAASLRYPFLPDDGNDVA